VAWHLAPTPQLSLDHCTYGDDPFLLGFKIGKAHDQTDDGVPILLATDFLLMCSDRIKLRTNVQCIGCEKLLVRHRSFLHPDGDQRICILDSIGVRQRTRVRFVNDHYHSRIEFDDSWVSPWCVSKCAECAIVQCQYCLAV